MKTSTNSKTTKLLCGVQGCCPEVHLTKKKVCILDDYGNKVKMTREQWDYFVRQYKQKDK